MDSSKQERGGRAPALRTTGVRSPWAWRRFTALTFLLTAVAALSACRPEQPVPVAFPDDPRVVNGTWELTVTGLGTVVDRAVLAPAGDRLLLSNDGDAWLYERTGADTWSAADAEPYRTFLSSPFDEATGSLVTITRSGATATATSVALADAAKSQRQFALPASDAEHLTVGSGNLFAVYLTAGGAREVRWWDLASGEPGGTVVVPRSSNGMRRSAGGRFLSFWEVRGGKVTVLDTSDPAQVRTFDLGVCRSNGTAEGSADGRWFVGEDCLHNVMVLDLHEAAPRWRNIGVRALTPVRMARGADKVVWQDEGGRVRATDLLVGGTETLAELGPSPDWYWGTVAQRTLTVDEHNGLLVAAGSDRRIHVVGLGGGSGAANDVPLPVLELTGATMSVAVGDAHTADGHSSYDFQGTFLTHTADAAPLTVYGHVSADRFHDYQPRPAALPPASVRGSARVVALGADEDAEALFTFTFGSLDRQATTYDGTLSGTTGEGGAGGDMYYTIELRAADR
mgnify:CR=1 FL=1